MIANLDYVNELGLRIGAALEAGDTDEFAELMHEHWDAQAASARDGISNAEIDEWYELARANGALGGKLVGAGAGGFLLFYAEDPRRVRRAMAGRRAPRGPLRLRPRRLRRPRAELMPLPCLVLGGGLGTRMRPATDARAQAAAAGRRRAVRRPPAPLARRARASPTSSTRSATSAT